MLIGLLKDSVLPEELKHRKEDNLILLYLVIVIGYYSKNYPNILNILRIQLVKYLLDLFRIRMPSINVDYIAYDLYLFVEELKLTTIDGYTYPLYIGKDLIQGNNILQNEPPDRTFSILNNFFAISSLRSFNSNIIQEGSYSVGDIIDKD